MGIITIIKNRIISDYFMKSRLKEYESILVNSLELGYKHISIYDYYIKLINNTLNDEKYFIHRHDIDTDVKTARKMFEIEKKHNIRATYYFRLSTLDFPFMKDIHNFGSEVSYHPEEISTYCKKHNLKSTDDVYKYIEEIRDDFRSNFLYIEDKLGFKLYTIAGHGDFVNRKLGITNSFLLEDIALREELGIVCEAYDSKLFDSFESYIRDLPYPIFYKPESIFNRLGKSNIICMLTHPRQWETNWIENTKDNLKRFYEGKKWR
jgi:hypothetical protein